MTKTAEKWVDFGTGAGQIADRSLPSIFTPTYYTPTAVSGESTTKVSAHLKGIDAKFGLLSPPADFNFTTSGDTSNFTVSSLGAGSLVNIWVQGLKQREGASFAWERNVGLQRIEFTEAVPDGYWVQIQIQ